MTLLKVKLQNMRSLPSAIHPVTSILPRSCAEAKSPVAAKSAVRHLAIYQRVFIHFPICALHFKPC